ncbi:Fimbrial assembly family protein [Acidithiobacillus ferrivorans SS3]|jgi:type IV pilus assembly protein PilN|uniref:Fimbrial assembly family protein n=1 Tax=Acidithiobacillus ferrivorans SS3 TaxID=743299 RepID=G0JN60_9PROT|nr:PilN domain-containing protein [Acidithiobacillus ferrivorans]AEM48274.1 Fimbrial assembly family protein [Acidithiobacillus ferrivorans SS3]MBU2768951.1 pilus assembly protein PilN [Acidithiobacillus ferrivorans]MBU2852229.1 pilus assembly protein PilN [Acidithiobacillus ferrivorans]OFA17129.1 pilus assembly protein PilN [Acidithiobacillus ferrivorans]
MIRINLLPYREAQRAQRGQLLVLALIGILLLAALLYYGIYSIFSARVSAEQQKVQYLQGVTTQLDKKIASIADLRKKRDELLSREGIITDLQDRRDMVVRLFNTLAQATPDGIFLTKLQQTGNSITVDGYSQANNQVAAFMRNIEASKIFAKPELNIISKSKLGNEEVGQFTLQMSIRTATTTNKSGASAQHKDTQP